MIKELNKLGFQLLDIIRTKTKKGIDFNDRNLHHILDLFKKIKQRGKPTAVDLFYSGRMLGSLTPSSTVKKTGKHKIHLVLVILK